jgi:hypothetical protein
MAIRQHEIVITPNAILIAGEAVAWRNLSSASAIALIPILIAHIAIA